jgi:hypothetical protein
VDAAIARELAIREVILTLAGFARSRVSMADATTERRDVRKFGEMRKKKKSSF